MFFKKKPPVFELYDPRNKVDSANRSESDKTILSLYMQSDQTPDGGQALLTEVFSSFSNDQLFVDIYFQGPENLALLNLDRTHKGHSGTRSFSPEAVADIINCYEQHGTLIWYWGIGLFNSTKMDEVWSIIEKNDVLVPDNMRLLIPSTSVFLFINTDIPGIELCITDEKLFDEAISIASRHGEIRIEQ